MKNPTEIYSCFNDNKCMKGFFLLSFVPIVNTYVNNFKNT